MVSEHTLSTAVEVPFATRMSRLGTETAFVVLAKAKELEAQGREIIHLEIGEPDFDTPKNIIDAGIQAIKDGYTHYTAAAGMPDVREATAKYSNQLRGLSHEWQNVVVTPGAKPVMFYTMLALVDEGEEVIYPNPGFPIYESVINFIGAKPIPMQLKIENEFRMDVNELVDKISSRTKLIIVNSPQNPTGGVLTKDDLRVIAEAAQKHDAWILSDEIYSRIIYEGQHESVTEFPGMTDRTVILDGLSKTYAMTGWRLGYGIMPKDLADAVTKLQTNCASCTAAFSQRVFPAAFFGPQDEAEQMVAEFQRRRDVIVDGLNDIPGVKCLRPRGAFYAFPYVADWGKTSAELEDRLLQDAGVAVLAGTSFGAFGEGFLRLSYANSVENIEKALERLKAFAANL